MVLEPAQGPVFESQGRETMKKKNKKTLYPKVCAGELQTMFLLGSRGGVKVNRFSTSYKLLDRIAYQSFIATKEERKEKERGHVFCLIQQIIL